MTSETTAVRLLDLIRTSSGAGFSRYGGPGPVNEP
jgi:hypothetical protein